MRPHVLALALASAACTAEAPVRAGDAGSATAWRPGDTGAFGLGAEDGVVLELVDDDDEVREVLDRTLIHGPGGWTVVIAAQLDGLEADEGLHWTADAALLDGVSLVADTWVPAVADGEGGARVHQARHELEPGDPVDLQDTVCRLAGLEVPLYVTVHLNETQRTASVRQVLRLHHDDVDKALCP